MTVVTGLPQRKRWRLEPRFQIVIACFLATFAAYVERVGFSISFTAMAKEANLDETVKGTVLSAFYWGYALSQARSLDSSTRACKSSVSHHVRQAQTCLTPGSHKGRMYLGSAAAMLFLPSVAAAFGAASLLKVVGGLGLGWLLMWLVVGREIPHRETVIPLSSHDGPSKGGSGQGKGRPGPTPWGRMLSSPALWAIITNNFCFHYAFYVIMNWMPTYFNSVLRVELASLGGMKTLPYLVMFLMSNVGGWSGDWLILKAKRSVGAGRKLVNTLGFVASAGALMLMPAAQGVNMGVAASTLTLGALGFSRGGFSVNHMDIAPKYAGMVMGISNTAGTIAGVIGVAMTGYILDHEGGAQVLGGWYHAHGLAAVICIFAMLVFNTFAKGERQFD
ncbi:hypothetical protein QJQ45_028212 [Haematococcus lacustris]|nr:hypothetical protein QJQ45_028212 [Haematococcus lacustris]